MKLKIFFITLAALMCNLSCQSQTKTSHSFTEMVKTFPEMKIPLKFKNSKVNNNIRDIKKEDAIKYLYYTEGDLKMNDYLYNQDEDIRYDNWVEVLPLSLGKFSSKNYIALVYSLGKYPTEGLETYKAILATFTYAGQIIDSLIIRNQYTPDTDCKDVVFLANNLLRVFDYKPNSEHYKLKDGSFIVIDEEKPRTEIEIKDYQIDENGKINLIKTHPKKYLKEFVSYYRDYHKDSDDPMNEY